MSKISVVGGSLCAVMLMAANPGYAELPDSGGQLDKDSPQHDNYIVTNAQTLVGGCTAEARQGPNQLHSAYITGRLAIHEKDKHEVNDRSDLQALLDKFEPILKHAWTTQGSLQLSYALFGSFEKDAETGRPKFNAKFNVDNEVDQRIDQAIQQAENAFVRRHNITLTVKGAHFKRMEPGCGL